jgi:hypothetical protein
VPGEDPVTAAIREFEEELDSRRRANFRRFGMVSKKAGKNIHAWAFEATATPRRSRVIPSRSNGRRTQDSCRSFLRWILWRIWSHRYQHWRNACWKRLPARQLYGEYKTVRLIDLIPSLASGRR